LALKNRRVRSILKAGQNGDLDRPKENAFKVGGGRRTVDIGGGMTPR